jgi:16S rRNA (guanine966-N2)-methyltransferase
LSRGAAHVTFVERDPRAVALIEANLRRCGVADRYAIIRARFAGREQPAGAESFDVIFMDPPYGTGELLSAIDAAAPLVQADTLLIVEHAKRDAAPESRGALVRTRLLTSGDSALAFYTRRTIGET